MIKIIIVLAYLFASPLILAEATDTTTSAFNANVQAFEAAYQRSQQLAKQKSFVEAAQAAREALVLSEEVGRSAQEQASLSFNFGFLLLMAKQYDAACKVLDGSVDQYSKLYGKNSAELIAPLNELATCYAADYKNNNKALKTYKKITKIAKSQFGEVSDQHARALFNTGQAMIHRARHKDGSKNLTAALEIYKTLNGPDSNEVMATSFNLAKYDLVTKKYDDAIQRLNSILKSYEARGESGSKFELSVRGFLVEAYEQNGQSAEATQHLLAIAAVSPQRDLQDYLPIFKPVPIYPKAALFSGQQGSVVVEFTVDEKGIVRNPRVVELEGPSVFEQPSLDVAKRFRYAPAFVDGHAVATQGVQNKIIYAIHNN